MRRASIWRVAIAVLVVLVAIALALGIATGLPAIVLGAMLPPACAAALLIVARGRDRTIRLAYVALLSWGAVGAAFLSSAINDALSAPGRDLVPAFAGPIVEELTKAVGLVAIVMLEPAALRGVVDGIVCGALVGLGFTMTENVGYLILAAVQGGSAGLHVALWTRATLGGFTHAVFTATTGAGLGWVRERSPASSSGVAGVAFLAAVAQHVLWNTVASSTIIRVLCDAPVPGGPCRDAPGPAALFVTIPLVAGVGLAPGAVALVGAVVWARRRRGAARSTGT